MSPFSSGSTLNWANRVTVMRMCLVAPFVVCLWHLQDPRWGETARRAALAVFVVIAVSDGLDGFLARRLEQCTPLGGFLDPVADKLLTICAVVLLGHEGTHVTGKMLPGFVVVAALGKDLCVLVGFALIYLITSRVFILPRRFGKLCTCAQLAMVVAVLLAPDLPEPLWRLPSVLWWIATALAVASTVDYFRLGQRFIHAAADETT